MIDKLRRQRRGGVHGEIEEYVYLPRVGVLVVVVVQTALVLLELGASPLSSFITSVVVVLQVVGGVLAWLVLLRQTTLDVFSVVMGVGLGSLTFGVIAVATSPWLALVVLSVPIVLFAANGMRWRDPVLIKSSTSEEHETVGYEHLVLLSGLQFLFLSQLRPRFLLVGLIVIGFYLAIRFLSARLDTRTSLFKHSLVGGLGLGGLVLLHIGLVVIREPFVLVNPKVVYAQDSITQAAMSRSLIEFGVFDSMLMAGIQDRYHWLSWAWAGGMGNLLGDQFWLATDVLIAGATAMLFAVAVLVLLGSSRKQASVVVLGICATLLMDSSLENAPTVDFGGTSGFFGLLALLVLVPLGGYWNKGQWRATVMTAMLAVAFGFLGKVSFGLIIAGVIGCLVLVSMMRRRMLWHSLLAAMASGSLTLALFVLFLRPESKTENPNVTFDPTVSILGYHPPDLVDLAHRLLPVVALVLLVLTRRWRVNGTMLGGIAVTLLLLFTLDIRNSGPISFIWAISLLGGLTVVTASGAWLPVSVWIWGLPALVLGGWISYRVVGLQWTGQQANQAEITRLLWQGFLGVVLLCVLVGVVGRGTKATRFQRFLSALLVISIAYCMGSFGVQTMRQEVREIVDRREGIVRDVTPTSENGVRQSQAVAAALWLEQHSGKDAVFAVDDRYWGSIIAALSGRRAFAASDHSYHSHPVESVRRQSLVASALASWNTSQEMLLRCNGVDILVYTIPAEPGENAYPQPDFVNGDLAIRQLTKDGSSTSDCSGI